MTYDRLGLDDLAALEGLLWQLAAALDAQRRAVSDVDPDALDRATESERQAVAAIEELGARAAPCRGDDPARRRALDSVKRTAGLVRINAQACALLLADAAHVIGQALGTRNNGAGYDRRARRVTQPRATYAKAI